MPRLRIEGGTADVGETGIALVPWFTRRAVQIPWQNVMFVSPVPGIRHNAGEWRTFRDEPLTQSTIGRAFAFYSFEVALDDRHAVLQGQSAFMKMWLHASLWLKPLFTADDTPHPRNGCIALHFPRRWVRKHGGEIMAALEVIHRHSRFDLLVSE